MNGGLQFTAGFLAVAAAAGGGGAAGRASDDGFALFAGVGAALADSRGAGAVSAAGVTIGAFDAVVCGIAEGCAWEGGGAAMTLVCVPSDPVAGGEADLNSSMRAVPPRTRPPRATMPAIIGTRDATFGVASVCETGAAV